MNELYFDSAATSRPAPEVIEAMLVVLENEYGNPSSLHRKGLRAEKIMEDARGTVASSLGVRDDEIYFTSGGTEANTLALLGTLRPGMRVVTSPVEHKSVLTVLDELKQQGVQVDYFPVDGGGRVRDDSIAEMLASPVDLVTVQQVNNETGALQPIEAIGQALKKAHPKALFHVDGIQGFGKFDSMIQKAQIDLYSMSGHKIYGPKGVGALYVRKGVTLKPVQAGGGQERGLRGGTQNLPGIAGFGAAVKLWEAHRDEWKAQAKENQALVRKAIASWDDTVVISSEEGSPYILMVGLKDCKAEVLLHSVEQQGISISTGSACSKGAMSHVLKACGVDPAYAAGAIRVSFSQWIHAEEVDTLLKALKEHAEMIRTITRGRK